MLDDPDFEPDKDPSDLSDISFSPSDGRSPLSLPQGASPPLLPPIPVAGMVALQPSPPPSPSHSSHSPNSSWHNSPKSTIKSLATSCPPIEEWLDLPDDLPKPHARYADEQICKWKYVFLWYFLDIGREAAALQNIQAVNTTELRMEQSESNAVSFITAPAARPIKGALPDRALTLPQINEAEEYFCEVIAAHQWPDRVVRMFVRFFEIIRRHPARIHPDGPQALALYVDRTRHQWHQQFLLNHCIYNLAHFNDTLFRTLRDEINGRVTQELRELLVSSLVSTLPSRISYPLLTRLSFPMCFYLNRPLFMDYPFTFTPLPPFCLYNPLRGGGSYLLRWHMILNVAICLSFTLPLLPTSFWGGL